MIIYKDHIKSDVEKDYSYPKIITLSGSSVFLIGKRYSDDASWATNIKTVTESVKSNVPSEF